MAVVHAQDSEYAKEMCRWEALHTQYGPPGRPYTYQPYPTRMYRAGRNAQGQIVILEGQTAGDETERATLEARGFVVGGQQAALDACTGVELEIAKLAAERNFHERRMSDAAQAEAQAANAQAGARHLPSVPETPIRKRRGRQPKVAPPA